MLSSPLLAVLLAAHAPATAHEHFFVGRTEGEGTVRIRAFGRVVRSRWVRDRGRGRLDAGGALVFEQVVQEKGKPVRRRSWRLVRSGTRITGTNSDATGPVTGEISGAVLTLRYQNRNPEAQVEQTITLLPGGRTASSRVVAAGKLGLRVTVDSTIRKLD